MFKFTALIIEPREHKALNYVINNFLGNLSDEWGILIFHGNNNIEFVKNIVENLEENHKNRIINLINLNVDNLNYYTYSELFLSQSFYNYIPTDTFLVFQTDSIILKENKENINLFLDYDYVGAPWSQNNMVGNGGLSLRKKNKMLEILQHRIRKDIVNEDLFFSYDANKSIVYNIPHYTLAQQFSVETMFHDKPFGIHNCWKYISPEQLDFLKNTYPEINELIYLNSE